MTNLTKLTVHFYKVLQLELEPTYWDLLLTAVFLGAA
jgi:hypothetical protein